MENGKTSIFSNGLIWFGAAVSIAEILTGALLAPLGVTKGIIAILTGHVIGCALMYFAGLIGAKTGKSAMETVKISFGGKGSAFFSVMNILQLVGWTAVMIIGGARAAAMITDPSLSPQSITLWSVAIGALILVWLTLNNKSLSKLNVLAMSALFILTGALSIIVFKGGSAVSAEGAISFGAAVELSAAMPLSWLPLISDYTKNAGRPKAANAVSVGTYFLTSSWMYIIGLAAAIFAGTSDIAQIMVNAGLGIAGIAIIIFSTVTTTYLDAYSAGVSSASISSRINEKRAAIIVCIVGMFLAIFTPIEQYENFLYLIGSVFAPMISILFTDFFILKKDHTKEAFNFINLGLWAAGFLIYRMFMSIDTVIGSTLPVMVIISILCILVNGVMSFVQKDSAKC